MKLEEKACNLILMFISGVIYDVLFYDLIFDL